MHTELQYLQLPMLKYLQLSFNDSSIAGELRQVSFIYFTKLAKLKFITQHRINVFVVKNQEHLIKTTPLKYSKGIISVYYQYDISNYKQLTDYGKLEMQLEIMDAALKYLFNLLGYDYSEVAGIKQKIIDNGLNTLIEIKSAQKALTEAKILVKPGLHFFEYNLQINRGGQNIVCLLFKGHTFFYAYYQTLFHSILIKKDLVIVRSRKKMLQFNVDLSNSLTLKTEPGADQILNRYAFDYNTYAENLMAYDL